LGVARLTALAVTEPHWWTYAEAAAICGVSSRHIRRLVKKHNLSTRKVRQGKHPRRIRQVSVATLERLRELTRR